MPIILHLIPAANWQDLPTDADITNPSLQTEGFIHCTGTHDVLLRVANTFYRGNADDFVALHIDTDALSSEYIWEPPAHPSATGEEFVTLFPHVYGVIDRKAVIGEQPMLRDAEGVFVGYGQLPNNRRF